MASLPGTTGHTNRSQTPIEFPPELEAAFAEADTKQIRLSVEGGNIRLALTDDRLGLSQDSRDLIRVRKAQALQYLREHVKPLPDPVIYVGSDLTLAHHSPNERIGPIYLIGNRPYFALWPCVLSRFTAQADKLPTEQIQAANAILERMRAYVLTHFRPDQIARAKSVAMPRRPEIPACLR